MNTAVKVTLFAIAVVIGGMAASFIWFVATWDKEAEDPVVFKRPPAESHA
jgi:hypothetical protein